MPVFMEDTAEAVASVDVEPSGQQTAKARCIFQILFYG
jgi:hypothetical protein